MGIKLHTYQPLTVTMRQARLQLLALGKLDEVNTAVSGMSQSAQIEWEYAHEVRRDNLLVIGIAALLDWDGPETDSYFKAAALL